MDWLEPNTWREANRHHALPNQIISATPTPIMGFIKMTLEDGTTYRTPVRTRAKIVDAEFEPAHHSPPWDYDGDDPDGDGIFIQKKD